LYQNRGYRWFGKEIKHVKDTKDIKDVKGQDIDNGPVVLD